jgi:hypothetical protein
MSILDVYQGRKQERVMRETWGHLAPVPRQVYRGFVLFSVSPNGDNNLLDFNFVGLDGNPWTFEHVSAWWCNETENSRYRTSNQTRFWRWEGTYTALKNGRARLSGKTVEMQLSPRRKLASTQLGAANA